jgi:hypothetical protein
MLQGICGTTSMKRSDGTVANNPRRESNVVRSFAPSASIYSVHEVVRISRRYEVDRMSRRQSKSDGGPGLTTSDEWALGDPRNGNSRWGKFRDRCGAFVNSGGFQNASTLCCLVVPVQLFVSVCCFGLFGLLCFFQMTNLLPFAHLICK